MKGLPTTALCFCALTSCETGSVEGNRPDAMPEEPGVLCMTEFELSGTVTHANPPVEGESCDPTGTWTIELGSPQPDSDFAECEGAPDAMSFTFEVSAGTGERDYMVVDQDDITRAWDARFSDKSGSCTGVMNVEAGSVRWELNASETAPDGPFSGTGRYSELRNDG